MTGHADILDQYDSLRRPFTAALVLHVGLLGWLAWSAWLAAHRESLGDKNAGGSAVGIQTVNSIPLPRNQGETNPVANDTQSEVRQQPVKQERVKREPVAKEAIPIKKQPKKPPAEVASERQRYRPFDQNDPNRVYSQSAPALSSPMFSMPGAGQFGIVDSTLGTRDAEYAARIRQLVAQNWHPGDVDATIRTAPVVVATFELLRDGSVRALNVEQGSGISVLDFSVRRAILEAKFPPLPADITESSVKVKFSFELKR